MDNSAGICLVSQNTTECHDIGFALQKLKVGNQLFSSDIYITIARNSGNIL